MVTSTLKTATLQSRCVDFQSEQQAESIASWQFNIILDRGSRFRKPRRCIASPEPGLIEQTVEALIKATGIDFRIGGSRAFYGPAQDYVQVPPPQAYFEPTNWHLTALGHAREQPIG